MTAVDGQNNNPFGLKSFYQFDVIGFKSAIVQDQWQTGFFREAGDDDIQYLIVDGYRYDRPQLTPTATPTPVEAEPVYEETLGGWLRKQWDSLRRQFDEWREGSE